VVLPIESWRMVSMAGCKRCRTEGFAALTPTDPTEVQEPNCPRLWWASELQASIQSLEAFDPTYAAHVVANPEPVRVGQRLGRLTSAQALICGSSQPVSLLLVPYLLVLTNALLLLSLVRCYGSGGVGVTRWSGCKGRWCVWDGA
jgi:hypothetical protein